MAPSHVRFQLGDIWNYILVHCLRDTDYQNYHCGKTYREGKVFIKKVGVARFRRIRSFASIF
jgi:hypothetical protein